MTLERAFGELRARLAQLEECCDSLAWASDAQGDRRLDHTVVAHFEGAAGDLVDAVKGACAAISEAAATGATSEIRRALAECHTLCASAAATFNRQIVSYEWQTALREIGAHSRFYSAWAKGVEAELTTIPPRLDEVGAALLLCWETLVEHAGRISVSASAAVISTETLAIEAAQTRSSRGRAGADTVPPVTATTRTGGNQ